MFSISLTATTFLALASFTQAWTLQWNYTGEDFINQFNFWDDAVQKDPTDVSDAPSAAWYMPKDVAQQQGLVWVNPDGHFGISVDSTATYSGTDRRPSVRIGSANSVHHGLLILDAVHLPYGTGTWPAYWMSGADGNWPTSGEIDMIEGVGNSVQNTISYHTAANVCSYDQSAPQTAKLNTAPGLDCNALQNNDEACGNVDPSTTSFGSGSSDAGGGVWALQWSSDFIKTWHFDRNSIPGDITSGNPNSDSWPTPVTQLSSSNCNIDQSFGPQSVIFNIELCGSWEGNAFDGGPQACIDYVQKNPDAFKTAYFEINYLKYFT